MANRTIKPIKFGDMPTTLQCNKLKKATDFKRPLLMAIFSNQIHALKNVNTIFGRFIQSGYESFNIIESHV